MSRKRRQEEEEHVNHERWMVSYADFVTLLFAFFVVMYAISQVDNERLKQTSQSLRTALGSPKVEDEPTQDSWSGPECDGDCVAFQGIPDPKLAEALRRKLEGSLRPWLKEQKQPAVAITELEGKRLVIRLSAGEFFEPAAAALHPEALPILDAIGGELVGIDRKIRIEGHTDVQAIRNERFRNNWDLSAARAATVVAYLEQAHRIPSQRLAAVGMAATQPVAGNETSEGREANRRIDIIVETDPVDVADPAAL